MGISPKPSSPCRGDHGVPAPDSPLKGSCLAAWIAAHQPSVALLLLKDPPWEARGPPVRHHPGPISSWASPEAAPAWTLCRYPSHARVRYLTRYLPERSPSSSTPRQHPACSPRLNQGSGIALRLSLLHLQQVATLRPHGSPRPRHLRASSGRPDSTDPPRALGVPLLPMHAALPPQLTRWPTPRLNRCRFVLRPPAAATPCFGTRLGVQPLATDSPPSSIRELKESDRLVAAIWTVEQELLPGGAGDCPTRVLPRGLLQPGVIFFSG